MTPPSRVLSESQVGAHVLMTADHVGGVWTYALDLAAGYAERGWRTTLAVFGPISRSAAAAAEAVPGVAVVDMRQPLDWTANGPSEVREAARALAELCADLAPDVMHLNSPALASGGPFAAPTIGACHSCLATWWQAVQGGEPPQDFAWRTALLRAGMRACDLLIAPTRAFAAATAAAHATATPLVVHNGRRTSGAAPPGVPGTFAFTAGRLWDDGKNVSVLSAAARELDLKVIAAGPLTGPQGQAVVLPDVDAVGGLAPADVAAWLARRPTFISTALYEPFGLAVLEAAQAGCPLVLSDIPTFRELWSGAAWFVDPRDPRTLAAMLRRLADDTDLAIRWGERARVRAQTYGADAMVEATVAAYGRVVPAFAALAQVAA